MDCKIEKLSLAAGDYYTTLNRKFLARKPWKPESPGKVLSFMPGTVMGITVKPGDAVNEGDHLMVFRAMKMDNNILSPIEGTVKAVRVAEGDNLPKNALMIEIE